MARIIKSRDEYEPWLSPASYEPEPVSLSDVLIGIGEGVLDYVLDPRFLSGATSVVVAGAIGFMLACGHS